MLTLKSWSRMLTMPSLTARNTRDHGRVTRFAIHITNGDAASSPAIAAITGARK
jgi:hypothetical protein